MKQVTHEFHWEQVVASLIADHPEDFEDGYWQLGVAIESTASTLPKLFSHGLEGDFPGYVMRFPYIKLEKVSGWLPLTVLLEKGVIYSGPNRDQNGPVEGSQGPGENSGVVGENIPNLV